MLGVIAIFSFILRVAYQIYQGNLFEKYYSMKLLPFDYFSVAVIFFVVTVVAPLYSFYYRRKKKYEVKEIKELIKKQKIRKNFQDD